MKFQSAECKIEGRLSHPARGAWIEIQSPFPAIGGPGVAPRKGCVD